MSETPRTKTAKATDAPKKGRERQSPEVTKKLAEARTAAIGRVLDKHRDDFNTFMEEEAKNRDVTWKRKPTEREKREAALRALLEADPTLAEIITGGQPEAGA